MRLPARHALRVAQRAVALADLAQLAGGGAVGARSVELFPGERAPAELREVLAPHGVEQTLLREAVAGVGHEGTGRDGAIGSQMDERAARGAAAAHDVLVLGND